MKPARKDCEEIEFNKDVEVFRYDPLTSNRAYDIHSYQGIQIDEDRKTCVFAELGFWRDYDYFGTMKREYHIRVYKMKVTDIFNSRLLAEVRFAIKKHPDYEFLEENIQELNKHARKELNKTEYRNSMREKPEIA